MLDIFRTLPGVLNNIEGSELILEAVVFATWRRIAGDQLGEHAVPLRLDGATLCIAVSNLMWQRQLKDLAGQMLFKLNAALGSPTVSFIEFEIDELAVKSSRAQTSEPASAKEIENAITPELARAAATIGDEDLRRQFLLAAGNCILRRDRML